MAELLTAGKIVNTHGVRGELKLKPNVNPSFLNSCKVFIIDGKELPISHLHVHKDMLLFSINGISTIDEANQYRGKTVIFKRSEILLPQGEFIDEEILNFDVLNADTNDFIGTIDDVLLYPAHKVLSVKGTKEYLIPAVNDVFIKKIDYDSNSIYVHMMEGLEVDED